MEEQLDSIDRKLLLLLQADGRMSNVALAEQVNLSPSPCLRRLKRLEDSGVISGYKATLDRRRVGLGVTVFAEVRVEGHSDELLASIEAAVHAMDEVVACHILSGRADFLLEIVCADLGHYERIMIDKLLTLPGLVDVKSNFALRQIKADGPLPLTPGR